jgi:hypothetical protein
MYSSSSRSLYRVHTRTWRALSSVQKLRAALRENMAFVLPFVVIGGALAAPFSEFCKLFRRPVYPESLIGA